MLPCTLALLLAGLPIGLPIGLASRQANAAAFQLREDSAVSIGTAFAGAASSAETPATAFDNPAGLTQLPGLQIQLGAAEIGPKSTFHGQATTALGQPIQGAGTVNGGDTAFVPHGFITDQITPQLAVGLALTTPYGLSTSYGSTFVGRYQADKTDLETININPSVAYQVLPWLSLGAGVSAQYGRAGFTNFLNSSAIAYQATGQQIPLPDGYSNLHATDWAFGYNFGALIQPTPKTNIGLTYRSRVQHDLQGTVNFIVPGALAASPTFANSPASAKLVLPDTATLSLTQHIDTNWTAYAELSWTNWSQFKTLTGVRSDGAIISSTPVRYSDSVLVALGASDRLTDKLTLRAGTAYDRSPTSDLYRSVRIPDQDRYWLALGVSYEIMPQVTVDVGYAHAFILDASIRETSVTGDVLTGTSSNSVDVGAISTRVRF